MTRRVDAPPSGWLEDLPDRVSIVEVGPRDGLQNISPFIPTEVKIELVDRLSTLGFDHIEATSFVHPAAVRQMRDAEAVMRGATRGGTKLMVLVPNRRGAERAIESGPDTLNFVLSASESQNEANLRQSIAESQRQLEASTALAREAKIPLRLTISTSFGCPYEGTVPPGRVADIARHGIDVGATEVCLGDTTGMANPPQVYRMFRLLSRAVPGVPLGVHLHNTRGSGAANLLAALSAGVRTVDASIGGLGGCPFAPGATGNVCTEDMVNMLHDMGIETGVDLPRLIDTARYAEGALGVRLSGQVMRAGRTCDPAADGIRPVAPS